MDHTTALIFRQVVKQQISNCTIEKNYDPSKRENSERHDQVQNNCHYIPQHVTVYVQLLNGFVVRLSRKFN
jgi:hypothetical protein